MRIQKSSHWPIAFCTPHRLHKTYRAYLVAQSGAPHMTIGPLIKATAFLKTSLSIQKLDKSATTIPQIFGFLTQSWRNSKALAVLNSSH
jgi:hypothetical protein